MPEYSFPGVFVEEVSIRSKVIPGVPTSSSGFSDPRPTHVWRLGASTSVRWGTAG